MKSDRFRQPHPNSELARLTPIPLIIPVIPVKHHMSESCLAFFRKFTICQLILFNVLHQDPQICKGRQGFSELVCAFPVFNTEL